MKNYKVKKQTVGMSLKQVSSDDVFLVTSEFEEIFGSSMKQSGRKVTNTYMKIICKGKKTVYRRFRGTSESGTNQDYVYLDYRTMCEMSVEEECGVTIKPSSWFAYNMHNSDDSKKWAFIITLYGFILTVISSIITIITYVEKCFL